MKIEELHNIKFYIGQCAEENWLLLDNAMSKNNEFIWFHLNSFPSSYVIMYATLLDISNNDEYLMYGDELCKKNSKYKNFNNLKIIYAPIKKLTKGLTLGEVVVTGKKKTIKL